MYSRVLQVYLIDVWNPHDYPKVISSYLCMLTARNLNNVWYFQCNRGQYDTSRVSEGACRTAWSLPLCRRCTLEYSISCHRLHVLHSTIFLSTWIILYLYVVEREDCSAPHITWPLCPRSAHIEVSVQSECLWQKWQIRLFHPINLGHAALFKTFSTKAHWNRNLVLWGRP